MLRAVSHLTSLCACLINHAFGRRCCHLRLTRMSVKTPVTQPDSLKAFPVTSDVSHVRPMGRIRERRRPTCNPKPLSTPHPTTTTTTTCALSLHPVLVLKVRLKLEAPVFQTLVCRHISPQLGSPAEMHPFFNACDGRDETSNSKGQKFLVHLIKRSRVK